jgi:hypothetical protein
MYDEWLAELVEDVARFLWPLLRRLADRSPLLRLGGILDANF